ncbi:MAG TPA: hypothetical protein ENG63_01215 [Candidatus Desulfofervidus auxilii]|uniref:ATP-grasp domain-containing protein n=1 Tax=Desulfofervidus auxilii TaxID=1621989 RepID=A0A7C0Y601_DESA2|nr:hypothetical protein [Candidatus Desulfofervidus auxilii]
MNEAVLVVEGGTQIGLEIIRSLGKENVLVYSAGPGKIQLSFYSKYISKKFILPFSPEERFIERLFYILKKNPEIKYLIAISERNITVLNKYRSELQKYVKPLFPPQEIMEYALNRRKTNEVAQKLGIPIPQTIFIDHFEDIEKAKNIPYPVITKPATRDFHHPLQSKLDFRVKYFSSYPQLKKHMETFKEANWFPMVQVCCNGEETGFAIIMARGKPVVCFQYLNMHLSPVKGGVPVLRESIPINPEIKTYSIELLKAIKWEGVAEIDYIRDHRDGQFKLLEINGRFWGGTPLPSRAGLPFPYLLYRALAKEEDFYTENYKIGIKCRLLGGDTTRFLEILKSSNQLSISKWQAIKEYISLFFDPSVKYDVQTLDDPLPGIMDIWFMIKKVFGFLI